MKPPRSPSIYPCTHSLTRRFHKKCATLLAIAVATGLGAGMAFSQGNYYPPGSTGSSQGFGGTDTGIYPSGSQLSSANGGAVPGNPPTTNSNELSYVENILNQLYPNSNLTLHVPVPPGMTLATDNQLAAALKNAAQNLVANPSAVQSSYPGVTLGSLAQQIVADRPSAAGSTTTYILIQNSTFSTADVQNIVNGAVAGAYSTNNQGVLANIVDNAVMANQANTSLTALQLTTNLKAVVSQAISTMKAQDPANTFIVAAAALAGSAGTTNLTAIRDAAIMADGGSGTAITDAYNVVNTIRTTSNTLSVFSKTLNAFSALPQGATQDRVLATLYGGILADGTPTDASAILAAAIAKSATPTTTNASNAYLLTAAINASPSPAQQARITSLSVASTVATHIAANIAAGNNTDVFDYVGYEAKQNPNNLFDVAAAAATVDPNHANYEAHAIAYNSPTTASNAVPALFNFSQLNTKNKNPGSPANNVTPGTGVPTGVTGPLIDRTSAAAAIVAGLTTGVVEYKLNNSLSDAATGSALQSIVQEAVKAAMVQNGQLLTGAAIMQNNGGLTGGSDMHGDSSKLSVGAAGVITGLVSQLAQVGDTTIGNSFASKTAVQQIFQAAASNASAYVLQMAQAAGQALGYVSGGSATIATAGNDIATGFFGTGPQAQPGIGGWTYTQVLNAADFGLSQGVNHVVGAGASGVMNYSQHSATGAPVTDIFNL